VQQGRQKDPQAELELEKEQEMQLRNRQRRWKAGSEGLSEGKSYRSR